MSICPPLFLFISPYVVRIPLITKEHLPYNLGTFTRDLVVPITTEHWKWTEPIMATLKEVIWRILALFQGCLPTCTIMRAGSAPSCMSKLRGTYLIPRTAIESLTTTRIDRFSKIFRPGYPRKCKIPRHQRIHTTWMSGSMS